MQLQARRGTCLLFDMETLVGGIEALYRTMARDHNRGRTPRPEVANLDAYLEAGIEHDHEAREMLAVADYHELYKSKLTRRHLVRPMPPDRRLWTAQDIAFAESEPVKQAKPRSRRKVARKTPTVAKRRGTRAK